MGTENLNSSAAFVNDLKLFTIEKNFWQASLLKQLDGLSMTEALYKPSPGRHGIWQIVRHIAYWKHWALTYLNEDKKLDAKENKWATMPDVQTEQTWQEEIGKLRKLNDECIAGAEKLGENIFSDDEKVVFFRQLLQHDSYHCGQIGFLRAMQGIKPVE